MKKLIFILTLLVSMQARAVKDENILHVYGALGELYSFNSIRIGHRTWEVGKLNSQSGGLVKLFYKGDVYAGFGLAIMRGVGLYGSLGIDLPFWSVFSFRAELNAVNSFGNFNHGEALIGLTFHY